MTPAEKECLDLLSRKGVPENIIAHSRRVCRAAALIGKLLNRRGAALDLDLIAAASWLHDIAKMEGFRTGENHAEGGARILKKMGYGKIAEIVRQHVVLDPEAQTGEIGEAAVVFYADKRVRHTELVTLEERFRDLKERYGKNPASLRRLEEMEKQAGDLEARIFAGLGISPGGMSALLQEE